MSVASLRIAPHLRIALWQCEPDGDVANNLNRLRAVAEHAAGNAAHLLITPEMAISGYNIAAPAARERSDVPDGPIARDVAEIARSSGIAILYGLPELGPDDLVRNTIRLVDASGSVVATHHKTHLFGSVDAAAVVAGDAPPPVVDLHGWKLGLAICYEVEFPELTRSLALRGADVVCVPTANMPEYDAVQTILLPARALENQVYVAYANFCGAEGDLHYGGLSEVLAPSGEILARADRTPTLIYADLDRDTLTRSRSVFTYLGDRNPGVY